MRIRTFGKPTIFGEAGEILQVRGQKAWAVLARLLVEGKPIGRSQLAEEIFSDAEDPLGALRWNLAALRRCLGSECLQGDPINVYLPPGTDIDFENIDRDSFDFLGTGEFLEGIEIPSSSSFSTWLLIERNRFQNRISAAARRRALDKIAAQEFDAAIDLANACIRCDPFDEAGHILLVKALTMAGRTEVAEAHINATEAEFEKELGEPPSPALRSAARRSVEAPPLGISESAVAQSQIAAGKAALDAGAIEAGLDCLRRASAASRNVGDSYLEASALLELGTALVHTTRGFDDEGAIILRQAVDAATASGDSQIAASALRELGYVDAMAGRRPSAKIVLDEALSLAESDDEALAGIHSVIGFNLVDWGKPEIGLEHYDLAIDHARSAKNPRKEAWALGVGAWGHLQLAQYDEAADWLSQSSDICKDIRWLSFNLWVQAAAAEANLKRRKNDSVSEMAEKAFAMSCQISDPCWEAANARAIALCAHAEGKSQTALEWLAEARRRCVRVTDSWIGLSVAILADQARINFELGNTAEAKELGRALVQAAAKSHADAHLKAALGWLG